MVVPVTVNARWRRATTSASALKDGLALTAPFLWRATARTTKTMMMVSSTKQFSLSSWVDGEAEETVIWSTNYAKHTSEAVSSWIITIQFEYPPPIGRICVRVRVKRKSANIIPQMWHLRKRHLPQSPFPWGRRRPPALPPTTRKCQMRIQCHPHSVSQSVDNWKAEEPTWILISS